MKFLQHVKGALTGIPFINSRFSSRVVPFPAPGNLVGNIITFEVTSTQAIGSKEATEADLYRLEIVAHCGKYADAVEAIDEIKGGLDRASLGTRLGDRATLLVYDDASIEHRENPDKWMAVLEFRVFVPFVSP